MLKYNGMTKVKEKRGRSSRGEDVVGGFIVTQRPHRDYLHGWLVG